jgi:acyl carrier protein
MAPAHVVMLPKLPVTPNAKLDWAALPPPPEDAVDGLTATRSPIEDEVAAIWRSLPGVVDTHLHAGFFESGGHSLLSTVLLSRIRDRFGVAISVAQFFAAPTIAGLAAAVASAGAAGSPKLPPLRRIPRVVHTVPLGPGGQLAQLPAIVREQLTLAITGVRSQ